MTSEKSDPRQCSLLVGFWSLPLTTSRVPLSSFLPGPGYPPAWAGPCPLRTSCVSHSSPPAPGLPLSPKAVLSPVPRSSLCLAIFCLCCWALNHFSAETRIPQPSEQETGQEECHLQALTSGCPSSPPDPHSHDCPQSPWCRRPPRGSEKALCSCPGLRQSPGQLRTQSWKDRPEQSAAGLGPGPCLVTWPTRPGHIGFTTGAQRRSGPPQTIICSHYLSLSQDAAFKSTLSEH